MSRSEFGLFLNKALLIIVCISIVFAVASCEQTSIEDDYNPSSFKVDEGDLANASMDIVGASQLAIVMSDGGTASRAIDRRPHLAKSDSEGSPFYDVGIRIRESDYYVGEDSLNLEIYKMCVIDEFTIVSYISSNVRKNLKTSNFSYRVGEQTFGLSIYEPLYFHADQYVDYETRVYDITQGTPVDFNTTGFFYNEYIKSFLIDNSTGKVYSLSVLPAFDVVNGLIAVRSGRYDSKYDFYQILIDNGNLVIRELVPNTDIRVGNALKGSDCWIYVFNDQIEKRDADNKVLYLDMQCFYLRDSLDRVFKCGSLMPNIAYEFPQSVYVNGNPEDIDYSIHSKITGLFYITYNNISPYYYEHFSVVDDLVIRDTRAIGRDGSIIATRILNGGVSSEIVLFEDTSGCNYWLDDECSVLYQVKDKEIRFQVIDWEKDIANNFITSNFSEPILTNVNKGDYYQMEGSQIKKIENAFKCIELSGTVYYTLRWNESSNDVEVVKLNQKTTSSDVFVVEALNRE